GHRLLREDTRQIVDLAARADAIAIGPGLGDAEGTLDAVKEIVRTVSLPLVVDADAVRAVASDPKCLVGKRAVITPHSREFQTLTGRALPDAPEERAEIVREAAKAFGATILLKGHVDIVTDGTRVKFNYTGNPGMTVGGTGDVLCGVVAGLMSKGMSPYDAARLGAFTNGYAGDLAFKVKSYGLTSVDVADNLGRVLAEGMGRKLMDRAGRRGATRLVILGDVKHLVPKMASRERRDVYVFFRDLASTFKEIYIAQGNHDGMLKHIVPRSVRFKPAYG